MMPTPPPSPPSPALAACPTLDTMLISCLSPTVALLTYNQPKISNAFTVQSYLDLRTALVWARDDPTITVILLTGAGKHYCAGKVLLPPSAGGPTIEQEIAAGSALGEVLNAMYPKILIAAVNGAAVGWGCTQLTNFDLVYASTNAFFQTPFMKLGFVPEGGSSYTFPKLMGRQHASRLLVSSERVPAREMYVSGLVTEVIEDGGSREVFLEKVCEIGARIGGYSAESLKVVKDLMRPCAEEVEERTKASERERVALQRVLSGEGAKKVMEEFSGRSKSSKL